MLHESMTPRKTARCALCMDSLLLLFAFNVVSVVNIHSCTVFNESRNGSLLIDA